MRLNRRAFVRTLALSPLTSPALAQVHNPATGRRASVPITAMQRQPPKIDSAFTDAQRALIGRALQQFYTWFLDPSVISSAIPRVFGGGIRVPPGFNRLPIDKQETVIRDLERKAARALIEPKYLGSIRERPIFQNIKDHDLLEEQLHQIESVMTWRDCLFPSVNVSEYYAVPGGTKRVDLEWGNSLARAPIGIIVVDKKGFYSPTRVPAKYNDGQFYIGINRWFLDNPRDQRHSSSDFWAGVIAHEILHNLGHRHPPRRNDSTYSSHQMIRFERAVRTDARNNHTPIRCKSWVP